MFGAEVVRTGAASRYGSSSGSTKMIRLLSAPPTQAVALGQAQYTIEPELAIYEILQF
jgi:hypothetical protein